MFSDGQQPGCGDRGVALAGGRIAPGGCLRGLAPGCLGAGKRGLQPRGRGGGLPFQLAGLFSGCLRACGCLVPGGAGRVGGFPCRCRGLGGFGGLRRCGGRVRVCAAAGGLGLGQHDGDPSRIGRGDLRRSGGSEPGRLGEQLRQPAQRCLRPVPRRRRPHGRLAAHRVEVPDAALVAAELPRPAPLAGRQRPAAPRPLAASAFTCGSARARGHHGRRRRGHEGAFLHFVSLHFVSFRVSGPRGHASARKERAGNGSQATSPPPSRAS